MNDDSGDPDISFYTSLRYPGSAQSIIKRYCAALRGLHARLADDLRHGGRGEFAGTTERMWAPLATGVDRTAGHVELFEKILLNAPGDAGATLRNVVANIVSDGNFAEVAETHIAAPKAREGKFDSEKAGELLGLSKEYAEKFREAIEFGKELEDIAKLLKFLSFILKDIGIIGESVKEPAKNEVGEQVEKKLKFVIDQTAAIRSDDAALQQGQSELIDGQTHIKEVVELTKILIERLTSELGKVDDEVDKIEQKTDTLAQLLGLTLVSEPWVVDPTAVAPPNKFPARGVKDELHDIEDLLNLILKLIGPTVTDGPVDPPPPPPPPPDQQTIDQPKHPPIAVVKDPRIKKIYVYTDSKFAAKKASDKRTIRVRTAAFDLSGWLDLSKLRAGDVVETQIRVNIRFSNNLLYAKTRFDTPGLYAFADFARGQNRLSGDSIDVILRQPKSKDGFATPIDIAYQLIVESQ